MRSGARTTRRAARTGGALLVVVLALLLWTAPASAHEIETSYLFLDFGEDTISGHVQMPADDLVAAFGYDLDVSSREAGDASLEPYADELRAYAAAHLTMGADGETWPLVFESVKMAAIPEGGFASIGFRVDRTFEAMPDQYEVTFDPLFDELPDRRGLLLVNSDWDAGVFRYVDSIPVSFEPGRATQTIERDASFWIGFQRTVDLGVDHIEIGTDHILFIVALVLPSVIVFGTADRDDGLLPDYEPVPAFRTALWRVLKVATMFTVAHSITLVLGGLGIVVIPDEHTKWVELMIALSIAATAAHNLRPVFRNKEWLLAFGFGLFHGLGFAGLLDGLGLTRGSNRMISLFGFNVGVEVGQIVVILLTFPALFLIRRTVAYRWILYGGSVLLGAIALLWGAERVLEREFAASALVDAVVEWPRSLVVAAALTAMAAVSAVVTGRRTVIADGADAAEELQPDLV